MKKLGSFSLLLITKQPSNEKSSDINCDHLYREDNKEQEKGEEEEQEKEISVQCLE